jgi:hypothetical protein
MYNGSPAPSVYPLGTMAGTLGASTAPTPASWSNQGGAIPMVPNLGYAPNYNQGQNYQPFNQNIATNPGGYQPGGYGTQGSFANQASIYATQPQRGAYSRPPKMDKMAIAAHTDNPNRFVVYGNFWPYSDYLKSFGGAMGRNTGPDGKWGISFTSDKRSQIEEFINKANLGQIAPSNKDKFASGNTGIDLNTNDANMGALPMGPVPGSAAAPVTTLDNQSVSLTIPHRYIGGDGKTYYQVIFTIAVPNVGDSIKVQYKTDKGLEELNGRVQQVFVEGGVPGYFTVTDSVSSGKTATVELVGNRWRMRDLVIEHVVEIITNTVVPEITAAPILTLSSPLTLAPPLSPRSVNNPIVPVVPIAPLSPAKPQPLAQPAARTVEVVAPIDVEIPVTVPVGVQVVGTRPGGVAPIAQNVGLAHTGGFSQAGAYAPQVGAYPTLTQTQAYVQNVQNAQFAQNPQVMPLSVTPAGYNTVPQPLNLSNLQSPPPVTGTNGYYRLN